MGVSLDSSVGRRVLTIVMADQSKYLTYPIPNPELVKQLHLLKHPEGGKYVCITFLRPVSDNRALGYFAETDRQEEQIPSPYAGTIQYSHQTRTECSNK